LTVPEKQGDGGSTGGKVRRRWHSKSKVVIDAANGGSWQERGRW